MVNYVFVMVNLRIVFDKASSYAQIYHSFAGICNDYPHHQG